MPRLLVFLSLIFVSACVAGLNAAAISGSYGDAYGCKYAMHGENATGPDWTPDWILVTPHSVMGHEWDCSIRSIRDGKATLSCSVAGENGRDEVKATMVKGAADALLYTEGGRTRTLHRCR